VRAAEEQRRALAGRRGRRGTGDSEVAVAVAVVDVDAVRMEQQLVERILGVSVRRLI